MLSILLAGCGSSKKHSNSSCLQGKVVDVRDYGAVVDDGIDDYASISQAIDEINRLKGGTLLLHKGVYTIDGHRIYDIKEKKDSMQNFTFQDVNCLTVQGNGAVFDVDGDWVRVVDYSKTVEKNDINTTHTYSYHNAIGMDFINCKDTVINDLELDGNSDKTIKEANVEGSSHGIRIIGSSNLKMKNVYIHHYQADGLYLTSREENGTYFQSKHLDIVDSNFTNNARQGCSIIQARDINFTNCIFAETGKTGLYGGHSPMAGVDVEPNYTPQSKKSVDDYTGDILFTKCTFRDNIGSEYVASNSISTPYPIKFESCVFKNTSLDAKTSKNSRVLTLNAKTSFDSCTFDNVSLRPNYSGKSNAHVEVSVLNSHFKSTIPSQSVLLSPGYPNVKMLVENNTFDFNASIAIEKSYRLFLRNAKVKFKNNKINISKKEHKGDSYHTKFILDTGVEASGNHWFTDLHKKNTYFYISFVANSNYTNEIHSPEQSFQIRH